MNTPTTNSRKYRDKTASFSGAENEILNFIKQGFNSAEIVKKRNCSIRTIEKHRSNSIKKPGFPPDQNALLHWLYQNIDLCILIGFITTYF